MARAEEVSETPFKFASIPPPLTTLNVKNASSLYARTDNQSLFGAQRRRTDIEYDTMQASQRQQLAEDFQQSASEGQAGADEGSNGASIGIPKASTSKGPSAKQELDVATVNEPGSRTIVVQFGSSTLKIGLASQPQPASVPFVIARPSANAASFPPDHSDLVDPNLDSKIDTMRVELRARMRSNKLRGTTNGQNMAREFNENVQPEPLSQADDDHEWTDTKSAPTAFFVGHQAINIANPAAEGFVLRWPFCRGRFNTGASYYQHRFELLADIEDILTVTLQEQLSISPSSFHDYNIAFLAPDSSDYTVLRSTCDLFMRTMGFRGILLQNESVAAALGSGLSGGCVVDLGSSSMNIGCVEDGWLVPDSRMILNYGGDDMTMFMMEEFRRAAFPYKEAKLSNIHDWFLIQHLKDSVSALGEADVSMSTHHFEARRPGHKTHKYSLRLYDEPLLGSMIVFAPRVVDFDSKDAHPKSLWPSKDEVDDAMDWPSEPTLAMKNSAVFHPGASAAPAPSGAAEGVNADGTPAPAAAGEAAPTVDYQWESGKLPLDLAILESLTSLGTEDRIKKMAGAILITGGLANIHNIAWGVSSRLSVLLSQRYPSLSSGIVNVVPGPPDLDPAHLAWKGVSMLSRVEVANEFWVRADEYEKLDFRAVRDRSVLPV